MTSDKKKTNKQINKQTTTTTKLKEIKKNKAPGTTNLTSDIMKPGGEESVKQFTFFYQILETKKIPAIMGRRDMKDIINFLPISLLSHMYKLFTRIL